MRDKILAMIAEVCEDDIVIEEPDINMAEEELMTSLEYTELLIKLEDELGVIHSAIGIHKRRDGHS